MFCGCERGLKRQGELAGGPCSWLTGDLDSPAQQMGDDVVADIQTQTAVAFAELSRVERFKNFCQHVLTHALTVVLHPDANALWSQFGIYAYQSTRMVTQAVDKGITDQSGEHLFQCARVTVQ